MADSFTTTTTVGQSLWDKRILVVDDVELIGHVVIKHLTNGGFRQIRYEMDANRALETIAEYRPDMILLDVRMPDITGLELLQLIRAKTEFDNIIVVMLSSAGRREQFEALEMGALGFIQKPITSDNLTKNVISNFEIARRIGLQ